MKSSWSRDLTGAVIVLVILFGMIYAGDWLDWKYRSMRGTGYGTVEVHQFLATSLKGGKTEYDLTGTVQQTCSRSIFPQQGYSACWWLRRHAAQWE
jgi:hypothetical protein